MLKYLVAFLAVGAVTVNAQGGPLPYQAVLDPDFIVSWGLNASTEVMTVEIYADTIGWAMLKILSPSGTLLDVWWGGYDQDYNASYIEVKKLRFNQGWECSIGELGSGTHLSGYHSRFDPNRRSSAAISNYPSPFPSSLHHG